MLTLGRVIKSLEKFKGTQGIDAICNTLYLLEMPNTGEESIESLRNQLNCILSQASFSTCISDNIKLHDVIYDALLVLAEFKPINDGEMDPITFENDIDDINRVFVSTGHQYNIHSLMKCHFFRIKYQQAGKGILNPLAGTFFSEKDEAHILQVANKISAQECSENLIAHAPVQNQIVNHRQPHQDRNLVGMAGYCTVLSVLMFVTSKDGIFPQAFNIALSLTLLAMGGLCIAEHRIENIRHGIG